jgi:hypothetical protein
MKAVPFLFFLASAIFAMAAVVDLVSGHWGRSIFGIGGCILWFAIGYSIRLRQKRN